MSARNITVEEAAARLGKSVQTVRRLLAQGELAGQKIGGRWLVHGEKLPNRASASATASFPTSVVNVEQALQHVLRTDRRELWVPDVLNWEDYRESPDQILAAARSKCVTGATDPFEVVEVPKGQFLSRSGTLLSLEDRVAYHALCASFCHLVEAQLSDRVFSSRIDPGRGGGDFFKSGLRQWRAFESEIASSAEDSSWLVETDLVSYFETISHQLLFEDLQNLGVPSQIANPLRSLLRDWRRDSRHGLPIGSDASRLLGNFFMARIDEMMLSEGHDYFRFMDDIRILADSENGALAALRRFEVLCRERGLIVSGPKTSVGAYSNKKPSKDARALDLADYFFRNGFRQARTALRDLFSDALAEKSLKKRHAKFALLRLGSLVDRGVLRKMLARLDRLKEVSPDSAFYLRSFVSERDVQDALTQYLTREREPGMEAYQEAWLLAVMLEVLNNPPREWIDFAAVIAWDANQPTYLKVLAANVVALGRRSFDIDKLRNIAKHDYDPAVVRGVAAALKRVDCLDKPTEQRIINRLPQLKTTLDYLRPRGALPSLVQEGMWSSVRKIPNV